MSIKQDVNSFVSQVPVYKPMDLMVEASPRRIYANAHTYHINSVSVNSDQQLFMSADDLRINLWHLEITDQSFSILHFLALCHHCPLVQLISLFVSPCVVVVLDPTLTDIVDIKPANMEELTEVITAAEFHPKDCNTFVYSSSKGSIRLCDMRQRALCDAHSKRKSAACGSVRV